MPSKICCLFLFTLFLCGSVCSIELQPTPLQNQFKQNLALMDSDEFKDLNQNDIQGNDKAPEVTYNKRVSTGKAVLYSVLLPGLGEYYIGHKTKAKYFFAAEALTWVGYISLRTYGGWKTDDMIRFASEKANANLEGKDDFFQDMLGFYINIDQYNTLGRVSDPERPYLEDTPENHWYWSSTDDQEAYRNLKNSARDAYRRSDFLIGVAVLNRIISVIDSVRDAKRANNKIGGFSVEEQRKFEFSVTPFKKQQVSITMFTPF